MKIKDNMWRLAWHVTIMLNCRHLCCPCKGEGRDYSRMQCSDEVFRYVVSVSYEKEVSSNKIMDEADGRYWCTDAACGSDTEAAGGGMLYCCSLLFERCYL